MAEFKMPELNSVIVAGNLTKDPIFRETSNKTPVVNFHIAVNRRYKDSSNQWQEDVCYVGVVAWNKLADSCRDRLRKGSAVLVDGELQSRTFKTDDGKNRTIVEIKAKRIQFLNKFAKSNGYDEEESVYSEDENDNSDYEENSFDKFLTDEESDLINDKE
ncbi:MAG: single-stranded DNA-binding protein [Melioribacteraceae bacterium]|jgi:single-strand DNA-binding protein|nr:single-stranded DNA-binding protein [Ignavibacteriota bacterium]MBZ0181103.1 single-stranded DNA-binding protein [Melioribacteraceae bacterium]|tara:strand:+ start:130 stop:609 length:480 start_codon:yes stop_codon:yes gene_type:complete